MVTITQIVKPSSKCPFCYTNARHTGYFKKSTDLCGREHGLIDLTLLAQLNLLSPLLMYLPLAKCPIQKPTKMPCLYLPYDTIPFPFIRAVLDIPTRPSVSIKRSLKG